MAQMPIPSVHQILNVYCYFQQTLTPMTDAAKAIQSAEESGKSLLEVGE